MVQFLQSLNIPVESIVSLNVFVFWFYTIYIFIPVNVIVNPFSPPQFDKHPSSKHSNELTFGGNSIDVKLLHP